MSRKPAPARAGHFGPELFAFFRELSVNNERAWFQANKARYEAAVRQPMLRFIADLAPRLAEVAPHYVANPAPIGGSMFRIHRDTRFSKDKSPYKTRVAARFHHERAREGVHGPVLYVGLGPDGRQAGGGIWQPEPPALAKIRDAIAYNPDRWRTVLATGIAITGEALTRPPRGYEPGHEFIADIKRKDFLAGVPFTEAEVCAPDFLDRYLDACRTVAPLLDFLAYALDFDLDPED